jgi:hypothetical protein
MDSGFPKDDRRCRILVQSLRQDPRLRPFQPEAPRIQPCTTSISIETIVMPDPARRSVSARTANPSCGCRLGPKCSGRPSSKKIRPLCPTDRGRCPAQSRLTRARRDMQRIAPISNPDAPTTQALRSCGKDVGGDCGEVASASPSVRQPIAIPLPSGSPRNLGSGFVPIERIPDPLGACSQISRSTRHSVAALTIRGDSIDRIAIALSHGHDEDEQLGIPNLIDESVAHRSQFDLVAV